MHELSIATHILELAEEEARKAGCTKILDIELEIGALAGVQQDALCFGFEAVSKNSMAELATLTIITRQGQAKCSGCNASFPVQSFFEPCPHCATILHTIEQGEELHMVAVNAE
ncbi:MAG: hydrogenase maturation nickel metallochaperone HypA [Desulfobulbaceae bacterium]|jgi:hydrogenase nickel incorporation protein HypA/HybF|nr:hydrogenase maturation nickel metallochaperone HypA [Desulfobulbaceae bacterium]